MNSVGEALQAANYFTLEEVELQQSYSKETFWLVRLTKVT